MTSLTVEQKKELCLYLGRAQGRNADYAIECDGDDADALLSWWQQHQQKAAARSAKRENRHTTAERQQQSLAEQCLQVIRELADVYGVTTKEVIKQLQAKIETARVQEQQKAFDAEKAASAKIEAFKAAHSELIAEWEDLQTEQQKQALRCNKLSTLEQRKRGRVRSKKSEPETEVKTRVLF